jgi:hypothetical protein
MPISLSSVAHVVREFDEMSFAQRIRKLTVTPQPNAVLIEFTTNVPTIPVVEIFHLAHDPQGDIKFDPSLSVGAQFDFLDAALGNLFTEHHARVPGLDQNTSYSYRITAGNGPLPASVAIGSFSTGQRSADVVIREIQIWNDGDPGLLASGELDFTFGLYDQDDDLMFDRNFARNIETGEVVDLPFGREPAFRVGNARDSMTIYVQGREHDGPLIGVSFTSPEIIPKHLPEAPTHSDTDEFARADAFQRLELPNETGHSRLGFSLNSGPQSIFYIINGWFEVEVKNPPPTFVEHFPLDELANTTTTLVQMGARQPIHTTDGRMHVFGLGPDGVIAHRLPRVPRQPRRKWELIPTDGAESATIIARARRYFDIITVADGTVRAARRAVDSETPGPAAEWTVIGEDMQPALTAMLPGNGAAVLAGLTRSGDVRATLLRGGRYGAIRWSELGGYFVGRVAALATDDGIELFAVTAGGEVQTTSWHPDSSTPGRWRSLGGEYVTHVVAIADEAGKHLVALTRERVLLTLLRGRKRFSKQWRVLGTLDDLGREEHTSKLGQEGWEMIGTTRINMGGSVNDSGIYFKRLK